MPQNLKSELAPGRFIISFRNRLMDFFYSYMSMVNDLAGGWGILMTSAYYPRVLGPGPYIRTLYLRPHDCDTLVHCRELTSNQPCLSKLLQTSWNWFWHAGQRSNMVTHVLNTHSDWLISLFADHPSCYTDHRHWFKLVQTSSFHRLRLVSFSTFAYYD